MQNLPIPEAEKSQIYLVLISACIAFAPIDALHSLRSFAAGLACGALFPEKEPQ
jgi:hypothetical protein